MEMTTGHSPDHLFVRHRESQHFCSAKEKLSEKWCRSEPAHVRKPVYRVQNEWERLPAIPKVQHIRDYRFHQTPRMVVPSRHHCGRSVFLAHSRRSQPATRRHGNTHRNPASSRRLPRTFSLRPWPLGSAEQVYSGSGNFLPIG